MGTTRVGPFVLLGRLGTGGFGTVFDARDTDGTGARVMVAAEVLARHPGFRDRFTAQVARASADRGPWIAPWLAAGPHDQDPWLAVGQVSGPTLAQAVEQGGVLGAEQVRSLAGRLAAALGALHATGLAHHDLTPAAMVLGTDGPYLLDFGIPRDADGVLAGAAPGPPDFRSPEQVRGKPGGLASDVFSLASVIGFAATGRSPFRGVPGEPDNPIETARRIVEGAPELTALPEDLRDALLPCFHLDPAARPTPAWLAARLAGSTAAPTVPPLVRAAPPVPDREQPRKPRPDVFALVFTVLLAIVLVVGFGLSRPDAPGPKPNPPPKPLDARVSALVASGGNGIALSRDGRRLYTAGLGLMAVDTESNTVIYEIRKPYGIHAILLSPDEQRVYLLYYNGPLHVHRASDGAELAQVTLPGTMTGIPSPSASNHMALTPDGRKLYVPHSNGKGVALAVIDTATLGFSDIPITESAVNTLVMTADGSRVLVGTGSLDGEIRVIDTATSRVVGALPGDGDAIALAPDGVSVYAADDTPPSRIARFDLPGLRQVATLDLGSSGPPAYTSVHSLLVSSDGRRLYAAFQHDSRTGILIVIDTANGHVVDRIPLPGSPKGLAISPDRNRLYVDFIGQVHRVDVSAQR